MPPELLDALLENPHECQILADGDGRVDGAVGKPMFWHMKQLKDLVRQVEVLEDRLDYYQKELQAIYPDWSAIERVAGESPAIRHPKREG